MTLLKNITFRCPRCGHVVDKFVAKDKVDHQLCPLCKLTTTMKVIPLVKQDVPNIKDFRSAP